MFALFFPFADVEKLKKYSCRSSVISMRSFPPQYPRSSTTLNPFPSLFLFSFFLLSPTLSLIFLLLFPPFLSVLSSLFLSFCPDPPSFFWVFLPIYVYIYIYIVSKNLQQGRARGEGTGYRGDNTGQKKSRDDDDDGFYYHSWRNNVVIAFGTLSSFLT